MPSIPLELPNVFCLFNQILLNADSISATLPEVSWISDFARYVKFAFPIEIVIEKLSTIF